jgi:hypothetical protein
MAIYIIVEKMVTSLIVALWTKNKYFFMAMALCADHYIPNCRFYACSLRIY